MTATTGAPDFDDLVQEDRAHHSIYTDPAVFDLEMDIAGCIDYVGRLPDGSFILADWKRAKKIEEQAFGGRTMKEPFTMLPDCNLGHYTLQLNLYKLVLLRQYGDVIGEVSKMFLASFHPECQKVVEVEDLQLGYVDGKILPYSWSGGGG